MYGLEKQPGEKFAFDLEKEIKEKPHRGKEILEKAEKRIQEIKKLLREGANEKDFDQARNSFAWLCRSAESLTKSSEIGV